MTTGRLSRALASSLTALALLVICMPTLRADEGAVKFAIFPSETIVPCLEDVDWLYVVPIEEHLAERADAELGYSYYSRGTDRKVLPPRRDLWSSNVARRQPVLGVVTTAARNLEANIVIMAWIRCSHWTHVPPHLYRIEVYVIDVDRERTCHAAALSTWAGPAAIAAIEAMLAERGSAPAGRVSGSNWTGPECGDGIVEASS